MKINSNEFATFMSAISRIYNLEGNVVGGGVLVADSYVLTCAHVVARALRIPPNVSETPCKLIDIDFPLTEEGRKGHKLKAKVEVWKPDQSASASQKMEVEDIAILKLEAELPKCIKPAKLTSSEEFSEHPFRTFGFPSGHEDGVWADGILSGPQAQRWIQMEDTKSPGYRVEAGFSGTPVWDKKLAGVVGITVAADTKEEVKAAFMIPTEVLTEVIPKEFPDFPKYSSSPPTVDERYRPIINAFTAGEIVPFFGSGIHLCDYPSASPIERALQLAQQYNPEGHLLGIPCSVCPLPVQCWPPPKDCPILIKLRESNSDDISTCSSLSNEQRLVLSKMKLRFLSQYIRLLNESDDRLYEELHNIWDEQYRELFEGNKNLHRVQEFFATLPETTLKKWRQRELPYPLIVTTTIDEMLENAFKEAGQEFDVVFYTTEDKGQFIHRFQGKDNPIPYNSDYKLPFGKRPIILKLYGTWNEKFVITEDHYLNYLVGCSIEQALPAKLVNTLKNSRILFLGYSLNDPDLKIALNRFWGDQPLKKTHGKTHGMKSWIIHQSEPGRLEEEFWKERQVDLIKSSLEEFVTNLEVGIEQSKLPRES